MIAGQQFWLWRAVDDEGEVLDLLVQRRRDKAAAVKLMRKLLKKQGFAPDVLVTDKLRSYGAAKTKAGARGSRLGQQKGPERVGRGVVRVVASVECVEAPGWIVAESIGELLERVLAGLFRAVNVAAGKCRDSSMGNAKLLAKAER